MRMTRVSLVVWVLGVYMLSGCASVETESPPQETAADVMIAKYTTVPVVVDGILNDPIWQEAQVYKMYLPIDQAANSELQEAGEILLAWNNKYFYVGAKFDDSDIVAEVKADQLHH